MNREFDCSLFHVYFVIRYKDGKFKTTFDHCMDRTIEKHGFYFAVFLMFTALMRTVSKGFLLC